MLNLKNINKTYKMGDTLVHALRNVSLSIDDGDFVAIMGPSGSGKSTLMHVLGLLDVPTSGSYRVNDREVSKLSEDELAVLRREEIGFIFQQFNLLPRLSAAENVALPLLYSMGRYTLDRASQLLTQVGLGARVDHKPSELSGGQQQRVAIARSLIHQPRMILADEPTGNLDSQSEREIMAILKDLNSQGITVVIVTHEQEIGAQAKRVIRMRDGEVQSDERIEAFKTSQNFVRAPTAYKQERLKTAVAHSLQYLNQGVKTLVANKVRTGLSMLGILIGVAAVVAMLALGRGAQLAIEKQLSSLGSNLLVLRPGASRGAGGAMTDAGSSTRLTYDDALAIRTQLDGVKEAAPTVSGRGQVTYLNKNWSTSVLGVAPEYSKMRASEPLVGRFISDEDNRTRGRVCLIGATVVRELFGDANPMNEMIKINRVNFQIIGVLPEKGASGFRDQDDQILIPVLTAMHRLFGKDYVDSIDVEARDAGSVNDVQDSLKSFIASRHRLAPSQEDAFQIFNMADLQSALTESTKVMTLLLSIIAAISLLVGGIGIMNIMLVSVTERTREVGLRKAIGGRRIDILSQFLAEAVVVSAVGGAAGVIVAWLITLALSAVAGWATSISLASVVVALLFSATVGIVFGIYPAQKAAVLNPIEALRHD